jgi:hypothetical protein
MIAMKVEIEETDMTYGIIFISALAAMIIAIAAVDRHAPGELTAPNSWSQSTADRGTTAPARVAP